jgi:hypothetical protein
MRAAADSGKNHLHLEQKIRSIFKRQMQTLSPSMADLKYELTSSGGLFPGAHGHSLALPGGSELVTKRYSIPGDPAVESLRQ